MTHLHDYEGLYKFHEVSCELHGEKDYDGASFWLENIINIDKENEDPLVVDESSDWYQFLLDEALKDYDDWAKSQEDY